MNFTTSSIYGLFFFLLWSEAVKTGLATSSVTNCVKQADDVISYRSQAPELNLIEMLSW